MGWGHCRKPGQVVTWPYPVEAGVEMPLPRGGSAKWHSPLCNVFPFEIMGVGDSFLVPREMEDPKRSLYRISGAASRFHHATGAKFSSRMLPEGTRCWRIA